MSTLEHMFIASNGGPIRAFGLELYWELRIPVKGGDEFEIQIVHWNRRGNRQGVGVASDGEIEVDGGTFKRRVTVDLWADSWGDTPCRVVLGKGCTRISVANIFHAPPLRCTEFKIDAAMLIDAAQDQWTCHCRDCTRIVGEPKFEDIVFTVRRIR
jgi:hypothetical protein